MLVLTRGPGQRIFIDRMKPRPGPRNLWNLLGGGAQERVATILLKDLQRGQASIGIEADPRKYKVDREEVAVRISREGPRRNGPNGTKKKPRRPIAAFIQRLIQSLFRHCSLNRFQLVFSP